MVSTLALQVRAADVACRRVCSNALSLLLSYALK
jgi:hypothetical protein